MKGKRTRIEISDWNKIMENNSEGLCESCEYDVSDCIDAGKPLCVKKEKEVKQNENNI